MYKKKNLSPLSTLNGKKKQRNSQILRAYNSQMRETILHKFCMWDAEGGGRLQ